MKSNRSVLNYLSNMDIIGAGIGLVLLVFLTLAGALSRYFLDTPLTWMEEVQFMLEVWVVFLGAGYGFRVGAHVSIEVFVESLPKKAQKVIDVIVAIVVIVTLSYLFYQNIGYISLFIRSERVSSYLEIPYAYVYGIVPICCVLMITNYIVVFIKKMLGIDVPIETEAV